MGEKHIDTLHPFRVASCAMSTLTHDSLVTQRTRTGAGLGFALVSAASFGLSGALARGLMDAGWSAASAVAVRVLVGALVLVPAAAVTLRTVVASAAAPRPDRRLRAGGRRRVP